MIAIGGANYAGLASNSQMLHICTMIECISMLYQKNHIYYVGWNITLLKYVHTPNKHTVWTYVCMSHT